MLHDKAPLEGNEYEYTGGGDATTDDQPDWLSIARSAYETSTDFLNANHRKQFERNLDNFFSRHPAGSKYHGDAYKLRSRLFRPKTRVAVRKNEASIAAALFTAKDVVVLEAEDMDDAQKRQDAAYWHEVINYRLDKTLPWFQLVVGAFQEAQVYGIVASKQYWEYEETEGEEKILPDPMYPNLPALDAAGRPMKQVEAEVVTDRPKIRLIEIENIRFDPACDWTDPVNSSPYVIECLPMYVGEVVDLMTSADDKTGQPEFKEIAKAAIIAAGKETTQADDTTKNRRRGKDEADHFVSDFETVWVHENIIKWQGRDYVFYTLGTRMMLTDPQPLEAVYKHGIRPFVIGKTIIEAHRPIPSSTVELGQNLQAEANDVVNQRLDNVKLALNKRYLVDRNGNVDLRALLRNVPGGITLADDVNAVKDQETRDVTSSAYQEQNRLDSDFDDVAGVFSQASVQNNRQLNETVGGMQLMSQFANKDTEYLIRTFVETWIEPVIKQLVLLEQHYEDDEHIRDIAIKAVQKAEKKTAQKTGNTQQPVQAPGQELSPQGVAPPSTTQGPAQAPIQEPETPQVPIEEPQNVDVRVNVGFGSLSPEQRMNAVRSGLKSIGELAPWAMQKLDMEEVAKEIFGATGHKNGHKFFTDFTRPEPQKPPEIEVKMKELEIQQAKLQQDVQYNQAKLAMDHEIAMAKLALQEKLTMEQLYSKLGTDKEKMAHDREIAGARNLTALAEVERKEKELQFKAATGRQGI